MLTPTRTGGPAGEEQRPVFSPLHHNRHLDRLDARPANTAVAFTKKWQVGATKEGVALADVPKGASHSPGQRSATPGSATRPNVTHALATSG